jgi:signal transduction histidine kinase
MLERLADSAALAAPLALTCASVAVVDRIRASRRRERLNRALHELRRPLQALALARAPGKGSAGELDLALAAIADLDREINGRVAEPPKLVVDTRRLVEDAVGRWRGIAVRSGRGLELSWSANGSQVHGRPLALARALDNLIANALEHGAGTIRVVATARRGRLRVAVTNPASSNGGANGRRADPRRGHGLRIVADVAARHGGRFAACRHDGGVTAVIELPLV